MQGTRALEESYNLEDALVIAGFLNVFVRNSDIVKMANMAQLVNVIAPIWAEKKGIYKQTIYYPLSLFANKMKGTSLDVFVDCETYNTEEFFIGLGESKTRQTNVPYLDVSAAYNNGEVVLCVVNRNKDKAITTDILSQTGEFTGTFKVFEVNGPDVKAINNFDKENVITVVKPDISARGSKITYSFPAHSFTMINGRIK
jgi:alpha-N-arabinofuranosidase